MENVITDEQQYLDCIRNILTAGNVKDDRTGVGTISLFGCQMRYSLRNGKILDILAVLPIRYSSYF